MARLFIYWWAMVFLFPLAASAEQRLVVHEWGTFTSLQNEGGEAIGGINTDDEPVPPFVHRLYSFALLSPSEVPGSFFQGAPSCHPDVTLRLETPVLYFHPPESPPLQSIEVSVKFRGGWLTEFYPNAEPAAPGLVTNGTFQFGPLHPETESRLKWEHLKIGGDWTMTNTSAHVWTSPRAVAAASVQAADGEAERFLFYRGVAHIDAPLRVSREGNRLVIRSQLEALPVSRSLMIPSTWLVDIQRDGKIAFRPLPSLKLSSDPNKVLTTTPAAFGPDDFTAGNLDRLKASLKAALISEGLFDDEAQALLNTWELSYFKSVGLRVFFIVPRKWTDFYLPLQISVPADINRVMVGRIELVTPEQRNKLEEISDLGPQQIHQEFAELFTNYYDKITFNPDLGNTNRPSQREMQQLSKDMAQVNAGQISLAAFISVPKSYQTYLDLGRFRNALILEDSRRHPTLTNFIASYRLAGYQPAPVVPAPTISK